MKWYHISEKRIRALMHDCYNYGLNEGWSFEEYVNDKIEDLKGYETR
jgi:hypothetical protein